jgi:hypothetical protein
MKNNDSNDEDVIEKLKSVFDSVLSSGSDDYPLEAMKPGTYVRANRLDCLGVILDAFYGDIDLDNKKIIIYTILLFTDKFKERYQENKDYYISNEYEYEVTGFLMINKIDVSGIIKRLNRRMY